jgi:uncharacterized protein YkwD
MSGQSVPTSAVSTARIVVALTVAAVSLTLFAMSSGPVLACTICGVNPPGAAPSSTTTAPPPTTSPPTTAAPTTTAAPSQPTDVPSAAYQLLSLTNQERAKAGVAPLTMRDDIRQIAIGHSMDMANSGTLYHNDAYFSDSTRARLGAGVLGENVAYGPDIPSIHQGLMNSPGHRANILDARFVYVGMAAVLGRDGEYWVTQDFVQPRGGYVPPPPAGPPPIGRSSSPSGGHVSTVRSATPAQAPSRAASGIAPAAPVATTAATPSPAPALVPVAEPLLRGTASALTHRKRSALLLGLAVTLLLADGLAVTRRTRRRPGFTA